MKKVLFVLAFILALPLAASAQTHPCDIAAIANPVVQTNGPVAAGFCHDGKDADGNPVTITAFRVTVDGVDVFKGPLTPIGTASATGFFYYETPKNIVLAKGQHTAVGFASSADGEGPGSDPFTFTLKGLPPGKAKIQKITK